MTAGPGDVSAGRPAPRARTLYLYIVFSYVAGVTLCMAPWSDFWERNYFLELAGIRGWAWESWVRGAVSGLGATNILLALRSIYELPSAGRSRS